MQKFEIAGISVEITSDNVCVFEKLKPFYSCSDKRSDLVFDIKGSECISKPEGKMILDEGIKWVQKNNGKNELCIYVCDADSNEVVCKIDIDNKWSNANVTYLNSIDMNEYPIKGRLDEAVFCNRILFHDGIVIHASAIEWEGKSIIFSAPGETGKSTQANLWKKYMGAEILNDDRPSIRILDNNPFVFGTPWSGRFNNYINSSAPLSAIIILEQAPENSIRQLGKAEGASRLMPRCFLPYHNSNLMNLAFNNLERIIDSTPIYLLRCKPDREAVELVYQCIK